MTLRSALCCFVLFACLTSVLGDKSRAKYFPEYNEQAVPQMAGNNLYDYLEGSQQQQQLPRFREDPTTITPTTTDGSQPSSPSSTPATPSADQVLPPEPAAATAPPSSTEATIVTPSTSKSNVIIGNGDTPQGGPMPVRIPSQAEQQQIQAQQAEEADPEMVKLDSALEAVKEDIMTNSKKIADEKKWVKAVTKITASYEEKVKRVEEHIIVLRKDQKSLFTKKKQIENLKLQRRLEAKLRDANDELSALQTSLKSVQVKNEELNKSHMDLRATIITIENQLAKLKGEDAKLKEGEGEEVKSEVQSTLDAEGLAVGDGDQGATDSESTEEDSP